MADRVVKVTLTAQVSSYLANMEKARQKTKDAADDSTEALARQRQAFTELGTSALAFGAIAGAGVLLAVKKFADFDQAMSSVQAATHESASGMTALRNAAIEAGASTVFTAKESANAIEELAKAGVSTADILGGALAGSLDLASAGELGVAEAAQIAATAMTQFNLKGADVPHIADLLAAGAGKAQGSVDDLSQALNQGGLVASQAGFSIEETTGTLSAFASAGLLGSDAGTSLKTAILALQNPSAKSRELMEQYGLSVYDSSGNMLSFAGIAGQLQSKLGGLDDETRNAALAQIFGNDAVRAANVLYSQGQSGIADWTKKVDDTGFAAETARLRLDNLNGDLEKLGGSFDTVLIKAGSGANDSLRFLTQTVTGLLDAFGNLPPVFQTGALTIGALVAGVGLLGGGFLTIIPKISATKDALSNLNLSGKSLAGIVGKGGAILAGLGILVQGLSGLGQTAQLSTEQISLLETSLKTANLYGLNAQFKEGRTNAAGFSEALSALQSSDFFKNQQNNIGFGKFMAGLGIDVFYKELRESEAAFKQLGQTLAGTVATDFKSTTDRFRDLVKLGGGTKETAQELIKTMPEYAAALREVASEQGVVLTDQGLLNLAQGKGAVAGEILSQQAAKQAISLGTLSAAAKDTTGQVDDLSEAIKNFGSAQFDVEAATNSFYDSIDALKANLDAGTASLDQTTEAGRATSGAMLAVAGDTNAYAASVYAMGGSTEEVQGILEAGRQKIIDTRIALGDTTTQAQAYADKLIATPDQVSTQVNLSGIAEAQARLDAWIETLSQRSVTINVRATLPDLNGAESGSGRPGLASGGAIYGPGGPRDDTAGLFALSNGEHVLTASDVRAMGGQSGVYAFRSSLQSGVPRYADGGSVPRYSRGSSMAAPQFNVVVSSKGGVNLLDYVDVRVEQANSAESQTWRAGYRLEA